MSIIVCGGPEKGREAAHRCGCCGFESDDLDAFAMSTCWPCSGVGAGNLDCERCVRRGVWVDRFSFKRRKGHRFRMWTRRKAGALTACGLVIPTADIGGGTAVREPCRRCWPEGW